ncbi:hypothetical protein [Tardiphaga robiniae]|uniref:Uncharacterized protein n=1 Tax=Tardiphaga robiniae TaxID=943830 RepID=A0A7G6U107_9BRAD|nr:hypothetical protein [Tardiphaga robiniae]QND72689.1 hypothetical protein HB776_16665 [Tardiphaga robiniae]
MLMEDGIAGRPVASAPPLVAQMVDKRTILEMEIALTKACEVLPRELDSHKNRCFVAKKILKRVNASARSAAWCPRGWRQWRRYGAGKSRFDGVS